MICGKRTVFPEPFQPTMRVSGALNWMVSPFSGPNERMLWLLVGALHRHSQQMDGPLYHHPVDFR
jgi:hypothetical protein